MVFSRSVHFSGFLTIKTWVKAISKHLQTSSLSVTIGLFEDNVPVILLRSCALKVSSRWCRCACLASLRFFLESFSNCLIQTKSKSDLCLNGIVLLLLFLLIFLVTHNFLIWVDLYPFGRNNLLYTKMNVVTRYSGGFILGTIMKHFPMSRIKACLKLFPTLRGPYPGFSLLRLTTLSFY